MAIWLLHPLAPSVFALSMAALVRECGRTGCMHTALCAVFLWLDLACLSDFVFFAVKFARSTSDIQRAYDAAPGPPTKGVVQEEGPPSAPPAPSVDRSTSGGVSKTVQFCHLCCPLSAVLLQSWCLRATSTKPVCCNAADAAQHLHWLQLVQFTCSCLYPCVSH